VDHRRLTQPHHALHRGGRRREAERLHEAAHAVVERRGDVPVVARSRSARPEKPPVPCARAGVPVVVSPECSGKKPGHQQLRRVGGPQESNVADLLAIDGLEVHIADQPQNAERCPSRVTDRWRSCSIAVADRDLAAMRPSRTMPSAITAERCARTCCSGSF
jgi:hypothetical protein